VRSRVLRVIGVAAIALAVWVAFSLGAALTAPGTDSTAAKTAEWARDHHLGIVVGTLEKAQYQANPPRVGGTPDPAQLRGLAAAATPSAPPAAPGTRGAAARPATPLPTAHPPLRPLVTPALPGEGVFSTVVAARGRPVVQVAHLRADSVHSSYLTGVAVLDNQVTRWELHPGYEDPGNLSRWSQPDLVPPAARSSLVATFNGGFKTNEARGGFYENGQSAGALLPGSASLVIYRDGHADVGSWGTEVSMTPQVTAVRQNLQMLIDGGKVAPNLDQNLRTNWGPTLGGGYAVWRSGVGVNARGDILVAMGPALTAQSLADVLHDAGAVRAMEMDINPEWMSFMWYSPTGDPTMPQPHKLVDFRRSADRYFTPTSRDFFAVRLR